jgi:hypothetical protein
MQHSGAGDGPCRAPPLARFTPAASRRAAVSAPSSRLPVLVQGVHGGEGSRPACSVRATLVASKRSDCRSGSIPGASILAIENAALDGSGSSCGSPLTSAITKRQNSRLLRVGRVSLLLSAGWGCARPAFAPRRASARADHGPGSRGNGADRRTANVFVRNEMAYRLGAVRGGVLGARVVFRQVHARSRSPLFADSTAPESPLLTPELPW